MISGPLPQKDARGHAIDLQGVQGLLDRIVKEWKPKAIWLFGSRARGEATASSDWDLLVVMPDDDPSADDPLVAWRLVKESRTRADVVTCRDTEFDDARDTPNTLAFEAAHDGVLIYER